MDARGEVTEGRDQKATTLVWMTSSRTSMNIHYRGGERNVWKLACLTHTHTEKVDPDDSFMLPGPYLEVPKVSLTVQSSNVQ